MPVKVTANKLVQLLLGHRMKVLKLVQSRELFHVEPIGRDDVGLALQQMFRFVAGNFRDGREDVREICSGTFEAVPEGLKRREHDASWRIDKFRQHLPMINLSFAGFFVYRKLIQVVVEIGLSSAQISTQQGGVRGEDGGDIDVTRSNGDEPNASLPLVEVCYDLRVWEAVIARIPFGRHFELTDKMRNHKAENHRIVGLDVEVWDADIALLPQLLTELVELPSTRANVEENDLRISVDQPATTVDFVAEWSQWIDSERERRTGGKLAFLNLLSCALFLIRTHQAVLIAQLLSRHKRLRSDDRVDAANLICRLPCHLKREAILHVGTVTPIEELQKIGARLNARITSTHDLRLFVLWEGTEKQIRKIFLSTLHNSHATKRYNRKESHDPDLGGASEHDTDNEKLV